MRPVTHDAPPPTYFIDLRERDRGLEVPTVTVGRATMGFNIACRHLRFCPIDTTSSRSRIDRAWQPLEEVRCELVGVLAQRQAHGVLPFRRTVVSRDAGAAFEQALAFQ